MSVREAEARCEISQNLQNFHLTPVFMPLLKNCRPLPTRIGGNFYRVSLTAPWVMVSQFWLERRSQSFHPSPFQNTRAHSPGKVLGVSTSNLRDFIQVKDLWNFQELLRDVTWIKLLGDHQDPFLSMYRPGLRDHRKWEPLKVLGKWTPRELTSVPWVHSQQERLGSHSLGKSVPGEHGRQLY